jgi:uncharacterized membrane protein YcaP (DUF421 family)
MICLRASGTLNGTQTLLFQPPTGKMLPQLHAWLDSALGLHLKSEQLRSGQMATRAFVVFLIATVMIRLGHKRFMGKSTAMDVMLGIVFGSVISRGITGNAPFVPTLAAGMTLIAVHWIISAIGFRSHRFGVLVKGKESLLVKDGEINWAAMKRSHITEHDLLEAMRSHGHPPEIRQIAAAHLERNGDISIIPSNRS